MTGRALHLGAPSHKSFEFVSNNRRTEQRRDLLNQHVRVMLDYELKDLMNPPTYAFVFILLVFFYSSFFLSLVVFGLLLYWRLSFADFFSLFWVVLFSPQLTTDGHICYP